MPAIKRITIALAVALAHAVVATIVWTRLLQRWVRERKKKEKERKERILRCPCEHNEIEAENKRNKTMEVRTSTTGLLALALQDLWTRRRFSRAKSPERKEAVSAQKIEAQLENMRGLVTCSEYDTISLWTSWVTAEGRTPLRLPVTLPARDRVAAHARPSLRTMRRAIDVGSRPAPRQDGTTARRCGAGARGSFVNLAAGSSG